MVFITRYLDLFFAYVSLCVRLPSHHDGTSVGAVHRQIALLRAACSLFDEDEVHCLRKDLIERPRQ